MRKILFTIMISSVFTIALAQKTYVGAGLSVAVFFGTTQDIIPLVGLHVGGDVAKNIELRGAIDTSIGTNVSADVLYTDVIPDSSSRWYAGGGLNAIYTTFPTSAFAFGLHPTLGVEYFTSPGGSWGIYGELQPTFGLGGSDYTRFFFDFRAGVNFHF